MMSIHGKGDGNRGRGKQSRKRQLQHESILLYNSQGASTVKYRAIMLLFAGLTGLAVAATAAGPKTAEGHPDLNGFWKGTKDTVPGGNIAKDLPGLKLPLT